MLNTTNSNSEYLHNYIRKVAKQEQETVDTSSVYTGTIEAAQNGIYTIVLNQSDKSSSVLATPIVSGDIYDKDDSVYLLRANTTATVNYFIVGKVNAIQEAFFNLTELERFNPNESKVDLVFENSNVIDIKYNESNIFDSIRNLGYFQLEMKITSKVEDSDKIIIYLNYTNESQYEAKFVFSSYEFIGQPGGDNYTLIQKKIFHLPSNIDIENIRIEKVGGFSVGAMNIVAGSLLEVSAAYQNNIIVQNDRNYFEKEIPNVSNPLNIITLTSKIYYNNKPLVGDALQYYWFLKDDSATDNESDDYLDIDGAGNGWRCLNTFTSAITADEQEIRLWDNKNNFIVLNKTNDFVNFSNFVNKVKCIVKYFDNFIESDLIDIYNYDYEQFSAILQSAVDNNILAYKDDKIILQCEVLNDNEKIDNSKYSIEYRWYIKSRNANESDLNITAKNEKNEDILTYSSLTIFDSAYTNTLQKGEYKLAKGKTEEEFYCVATIIPKGTKEGYHSEQTNIVKVSSKAAAADITQSIEYKYYISNEHNITFRQGIKQEEGQLSEWNGDWAINITGAIWVGPVGVDYNTVFSSFDIFKLVGDDEEQFVYYTQRNVWRERGEVFKTENWSFPQIARSVINVNGWKNHRVGDNVNQLNTFNQLSDNGKEEGVYYADIAKITTDDTPDWGTKYYERNVSPDGEISYTLISLEANIYFKKDQDYYIYNSEKEQYELVLSNTDYDKSTEYYEKINNNEYQKLIVNTQNFDITNVAWPSNKDGPFYTNIDNKLLINATYIRSGTLEVNNKFYASIDQDDVRIAGFNVNEATLESNNRTVGLNSDNSDSNNIAIWAGTGYPFQVTHGGKLKATDAEIKGKITATELFIGTETEENNFNTIQQNITETVSNIQQDVTNNKILIENTKKELQQQIDGEITTWFEEGVPIPNDINQGGTTQIAENKNPPSNQWVDDNDKIKHEGDLYYDTNTQYCFRWIRKGEDPNYTWIWAQIADEGITEALAAAAAAEALADKKRQIFYLSEFNIDNLPNDYNVNDMLIVGALAETPGSASGVANTQIYICITDKGNNNKDLKHWQKATDMINSSTLDNQVATINQTIVNLDTTLQGKIDEKVDIWYNSDSNDPSSEWSDDDKKNHIGDLWYKTNGTVYYWTESEWKHIEDPAIGEALGVAQDAADAASQAQATADGKITTYYSSTKPENPQVGDLWVPGPTAGGNKENKTKIYIEKTNGSFEWVDLDDSVTKNEVDKAIEEATETITGEYTSAIDKIDAKYSGSLYLTAGNIPNGDGTKMPAIVLKAKEETGAGLIYFNTDELVINSDNLKLNHDGNKYKDNYLVINSENFKYNIDGDFKLEITGIINATAGGSIGGFHIAQDHLSSGASESNDNWHDVMISSGYGTGTEKNYCFWAGGIPNNGSSDEDRPFWIKNNGDFHAAHANFSNDVLIWNNGAGSPITTLFSSTAGNGMWMNVQATDWKPGSTMSLYSNGACYNYTGFIFYAPSTGKEIINEAAITRNINQPAIGLDITMQRVGTDYKTTYGSLQVNDFIVPYIQYGTYKFETNLDNSKGKYVPVTFAKEFYSIPTVIVSIGNIEASNKDTQVMCWAESVTTKGFNLRAIRSSNHNVSEIHWIAFTNGNSKQSHTYGIVVDDSK